MNICSLWLWLLLASTLAPAGRVLAQGSIAYFRPAEPLSVSNGMRLDLQGDGTPELQFFDGSYWPANYFATSASGIGSARLLVTPLGPRDAGSYLVGWNSGYAIGAATNDWLFWAAQDAPNAYGSAVVFGSYIPEEGDHLVGVGDFYGNTGFMGIQFQIASNWHFGWVQIRGGVAGLSEDGQRFFLMPPGWILDWAYETCPNTPIKAGAKPVMVAVAVPVVVRAGFLRLSWLSEIGNAYQVQSKPSLDAFGWTNLNFAVPATTTHTLLDLPMTGASQFFRIVEAD